MANVKCKHCSKSVDKKNAIKEEYITNTLKIANRYFCSEECKKKFHYDKTIKVEFYSKCSEILGAEITRNAYFKKRIKEIEDTNLMYTYVDRYFETLLKNFKYEINRIEKTKTINLNYKIAVLINMISDGMKKYVNDEIAENYKIENEILKDYIDYENLMPRGKQVKPRKTIFDEGE